jgi:hypothetical protein
MISKEVIPGLTIGDQEFYESLDEKARNEFFIVQACKEPYHRKAVGYTTRAATKGPEYYMATRGNRLILNIVDARTSQMISKGVILSAIARMSENYGKRPILIHCNRGESRSPSIALLFMLRNGLIEAQSFDELMKKFLFLYPHFNPSKSMMDFLLDNWREIKK